MINSTAQKSSLQSGFFYAIVFVQINSSNTGTYMELYGFIYKIKNPGPNYIYYL